MSVALLWERTSTSENSLGSFPPPGTKQYGDLPDGNVGSDFAIKRRHFIGVTRWFDIAQLS